jgi:nitrite reductase/ring-hydroxylating ferredoxin subunit
VRVEVGRVALTRLTPGALVRIEHPPFHVLVARVGDQVHAMEDACPHSGISLCRGALNGHVVTCTGHGWDIDVRTGVVVKPVGVQERNPCFEVTVDGDHAIVWRPEAR